MSNTVWPTSISFSEDVHGRHRGWATLWGQDSQPEFSGNPSTGREFSWLGPTFQPTITRTKMPLKKSPDLHHRPNYRLNMATHVASVAHGLSVNGTTSYCCWSLDSVYSYNRYLLYACRVQRISLCLWPPIYACTKFSELLQALMGDLLLVRSAIAPFVGSLWVLSDFWPKVHSLVLTNLPKCFQEIPGVFLVNWSVITILTEDWSILGIKGRIRNSFPDFSDIYCYVPNYSKT